MRNLYFLLLLLPISVSAQMSVIEIFKNSASYNRSHFTLGNHTVKTYNLNYDDEKKPDMTIMVNEEEVNLTLGSIDKSVWNGNKLTITSTSLESGTVGNQVFEFDDKGNAILRETVYSGNEHMAIMNEKLNYTYDDKNRLINVKGLNKETKMMQDMIIAKYAGDDKLPTSAAMNMVFEFDVERVDIKDGFRYNIKAKISQELINELKEELGPGLTEAQVMTELQAFGMLAKTYSDITFLSEGSIREEMYEEDKQVSGKIDLKGVNVYNKDYNIIEKNAYQDGEMYNSLKYTYNEKGQPTSVEIVDVQKMDNEFDTDGNITKEYSGEQYTLRTYIKGKLTEEREYYLGDSLFSIKLYTYE